MKTNLSVHACMVSGTLNARKNVNYHNIFVHTIHFKYLQYKRYLLFSHISSVCVPHKNNAKATNLVAYVFYNVGLGSFISFILCVWLALFLLTDLVSTIMTSCCLSVLHHGPETCMGTRNHPHSRPAHNVFPAPNAMIVLITAAIVIILLNSSPFLRLPRLPR